MGIRASVTKPELYPKGEYLLRVDGNEAAKDPKKVKIKFTIAQQGPQFGKTLTRNFNLVIGEKSQLGELLSACGLSPRDIQADSFDLDNLNGAYVVGTLTHYTSTQGTYNSLDRFFRSNVTPAPAAAPAPVLQDAPAPAPVSVPVPIQAAPLPSLPPAPALAPNLRLKF